jgi:hypothetical protein
MKLAISACIDLSLLVAYYPRRSEHRISGDCWMSDWVYIQADSAEQLLQLHHFSIVKKHVSGNVTFAITVKEFATAPPGQRMRFYAEADKALNQKTASFVPCGWGNSIFSALGDCVRLIREFPYEGEEIGVP